MEITVRFPLSLGTSSHKEAVEIAEQENYEIKAGSYFVHFTQPTKKLMELLHIISSWKNARVYIDGRETGIPIYSLASILSCERRKICNGICSFFWDHDYNTLLDLQTRKFETEITKLDEKDKNLCYLQMGLYPSSKFIYSLGSIFEEIGENEYKLNKTLAKDYFREKLSPLAICDKADIEKMVSIFDSFPDRFKVKFMRSTWFEGSHWWEETKTEELKTRDEWLMEAEMELQRKLERAWEQKLKEIAKRNKELEEEKMKAQAHLYAETIATTMEKVLRKLFEEYWGSSSKKSKT